MKLTRSILVLFSLNCLLLSGCSEMTRAALVTRLAPIGGTLVAEGGIVARTAAAEAAATGAVAIRTVAVEAATAGAPVARTAAAIAASTGVPFARTAAAEAAATGVILAGTIAAGGAGAVGTRIAQSPDQCPLNYSIESDLTVVPNLSEADLRAAIAAAVPSSPLVDWSGEFVRSGQPLGVNPVFLAAHAAYDSAWGTSPAADLKNNPFGYGATATCPYDCALPFASPAEATETVTALLRADYLTPGGRQFRGATLQGMYAAGYRTNPDWPHAVAGIMSALSAGLPCP